MEDRPKIGPTVEALVKEVGYQPDFQWAFDHYKPVIMRLAQAYGFEHHLEIGAGRDPLFTPQELATLGFDVTLNDISAHELALASDVFAKVECDITAPNAPELLGRGRYDFAYCRMVMEHVADVEKMWANLFEALKPGGIGFSFFPTLYAPPYVLNTMIPEDLSRKMLEAIFPDRRPDGDNPKFPAHYNWCFSSEEKVAPMLRRVGFADVTLMPFWGYSYFSKFPVIKQIDAMLTDVARRQSWRHLSSFAYLFVRKPAS
jgi:SAM-dependent methyltransferase